MKTKVACQIAMILKMTVCGSGEGGVNEHLQSNESINWYNHCMR